MDNEYYSEEFPSPQLQYNQIIMDLWQDQTGIQLHKILPVISLHLQTQQMFNAGTHMVEENAETFLLIDSLEKRQGQ